MIQKVQKKLKDQRGLTLVELLAVVVILGIVAAIAIVAIGGIIDNSKRDAIRADAIQLINGANLYKSQHGDLPENLDEVKEFVEVSLDWSGVAFSEVGNATAISGTGKNGEVSITFTNATIEMINSADKKATEIK